MAHAKKEDVFYTLFKQFGDELVSAAEDYDKLINSFPETDSLIPIMKLHEDRCDECVKQIMQELYSSFITPFDRNDISELALKLDDICDSMSGVAIRLNLFNTSGTNSNARQLADLALAAVREVKEMLDRLPEYKKDPEVMRKAISIGHIEDEGDAVYESALYGLFHSESIDDARRGHVVAWLRIFDRMEGTLDACDHAAGIVRSIVMKSA